VLALLCVINRYKYLGSEGSAILKFKLCVGEEVVRSTRAPRNGSGRRVRAAPAGKLRPFPAKRGSGLEYHNNQTITNEKLLRSTVRCRSSELCARLSVGAHNGDHITRPERPLSLERGIMPVTFLRTSFALMWPLL
jgi:hypothetical protein